MTDEKLVAVVAGASGVLGRKVMSEFNKHSQEWKVYGLAYSRASEHTSYIKCDLCDAHQVMEICISLKPDVIINW